MLNTSDIADLRNIVLELPTDCAAMIARGVSDEELITWIQGNAAARLEGVPALPRKRGTP